MSPFVSVGGGGGGGRGGECVNFVRSERNFPNVSANAQRLTTSST